MALSKRKSVKITTTNETDSIVELDIAALMGVLRNPEYANYPVAIYSTAGPFRSGKSFMQSLLIHNIQSSQLCDSNAEFVNSNIESTFEWQSGTSSCTEGIHILTEPFLIDRPDHEEKVALYLMDTEGLFGHERSTKNATFLGTIIFLLSSLQCFNVKGQMESYHFEHIYKFVEFAQNVKEKDSLCSPNQEDSLLFIVRDWENEEEIPFGLHTEQSYFEKLFHSNFSRSQEHELMKDYFVYTFGKVPGLFLPHPGRVVKKKPCCLADLSSEFQTGVSDLSNYLLSPENLIVKQIHGKEVTCGELCSFIESVSPILREDLNKNIISFIEADTEAHLNNLVMKCAFSYFTEIDQHCLKIQGFNDRKTYLAELLEKTIKMFDEEKKRGGKILIFEWRQELVKLLSQCDIAIEACLTAEKEYLKNLEEFNDWITDKSTRARSSSDLKKEELILKRKNLNSSFRESLDEEIADQCCEYFENHCDKIYAQTKKEVQNFFFELRKRKALNICLGTAMIVGGVTLSFFGLIIDESLSVLGDVLVTVGGNKMFQKVDNTFTMSSKTFSFPNTNTDLQKYGNGKSFITFNLCFGKIHYPLKTKSKNIE